MRSWKTTLSGVVGSIAGLVLAIHQSGVVMPPWIPSVAEYVLVGGFASLGIFAKDSNVSGVTSLLSQDKATK
jgi:hypothetical protein